jgi:dephospho-CoA kinase
MKVVGAVGQIGSGKDTVIKYISKRFSIPTISIGDIAREIARKEGLPATRENLQKITEKRFEEFGRSYFIEQTVRRLRHESKDKMLITGIRAPIDVATLRRNFQEDFVLICVLADERTRFQRLLKRAEARDPKTWREFLKQDEAEERIFQLTKTCKQADYVVDNNGTAEELFQRVDEIIQRRLAGE